MKDTEQQKNNTAVNAEIMEKESMAVQKSNWVLEQIEGQRKVEDELRLKMVEEQKILEERSRSIEEGNERYNCADIMSSGEKNWMLKYMVYMEFLKTSWMESNSTKKPCLKAVPLYYLCFHLR